MSQDPDASFFLSRSQQPTGGSFKGVLQLLLKGWRVYCVAMEYATSAHQGGIARVSSQLAPARLQVRHKSSRAALSPGNQGPLLVPTLQISRVSYKGESQLPIATWSPATSDDLHQITVPTSAPIEFRSSSEQFGHTHLQRVARCIHAATSGGSWC